MKLWTSALVLSVAMGGLMACQPEAPTQNNAEIVNPDFDPLRDALNQARNQKPDEENGGSTQASGTGTVPLESTSVPSSGSTAEDSPLQVSKAEVNPKKLSSLDQTMTFKVEADSDKAPLNYIWSAEQGFFSRTDAAEVVWIPFNDSGELQPGDLTISCLVTDKDDNQSKIDFELEITEAGAINFKKHTVS